VHSSASATLVFATGPARMHPNFYCLNTFSPPYIIEYLLSPGIGHSIIQAPGSRIVFWLQNAGTADIHAFQSILLLIY